MSEENTNAEKGNAFSKGATAANTVALSVLLATHPDKASVKHLLNAMAHETRAGLTADGDTWDACREGFDNTIQTFTSTIDTASDFLAKLAA